MKFKNKQNINWNKYNFFKLNCAKYQSHNVYYSKGNNAAVKSD